ncbi:hypothetical protein GGR57DRAFT_419897 [Xylariaceae sp. FL1272]|nr:hypothetical protein GGR57DRAFT_419897 [Xylariaceae sp. FL1272]
MKSPRQLLTVALALSPLAAAWSQWLPDKDSLIVRADDESSTVTEATQTSDTSEAATKTSEETSKKTTDEASETTTGKTTKTSKTSAATHTSYDALDPVGGVQMITPAPTAAETYYRINNPTPVTWVWNYTSVQGTPKGIDVWVSCSTVSESWTLTQNMTYHPTQTFTWDINKFQSQAIESQLPVAEYTLIVFDSDTAYTDTADPGYLGPFDGFTFGLYTPKPYSNLSDWECITCSAGSALDRTALGFAASMVMITVFTFTYYVTGALL